MKTWTTRHGGSFGVALSALATLSACALEPETASEGEDTWGADQLVGANSVGRRVAVDGVVFVPTTATTAQITAAVTSQMRVLFGAARGVNIGLSERYPIINTASFVRDTVAVVDPASPETVVRNVLRVRYTYRARAVVPRTMESAGSLATATLFATNYATYAGEIVRTCQPSDTQNLGAGTVWYHFDPTIPTCASAIRSEVDRIAADRRRLTAPDRQVTTSEAARRFLPLVMRFSPLESNEAAYPEYQKLYEDGRFVGYSFFGLDREDDPWDYGARNYFNYLRAMLAGAPALRITGATDNTDLLSVTWRGQPVANVTYERVLGWVLDGRDYPREVAAADINAFRLQILRQWRGHYVTLSMSASLTAAGATRTVPIEVRTYYGDEEGPAAAGAVRRYTEAFGQTDVFQYTGHSHLGSGPLDPSNYRSTSFANRYQVMMVNSCVSFNYYNQFFGMHPGGTANLDTVSNGIEVYLEGAGLSSARFMLAMIDGRFRNYRDILTSMKLNLPWASDYDPNRVADGELDNQFTPARFPMTLRPAQ